MFNRVHVHVHVHLNLKTPVSQWQLIAVPSQWTHSYKFQCMNINKYDRGPCMWRYALYVNVSFDRALMCQYQYSYHDPIQNCCFRILIFSEPEFDLTLVLTYKVSLLTGWREW